MEGWQGTCNGEMWHGIGETLPFHVVARYRNTADIVG